ncbi:unnamed protein product [Ectocarpus sp. 4 AP-2014]
MVLWVGDGTEFSSNHVEILGGAIAASYSKLSWDGNSTRFSSNVASFGGGAIFAEHSTVSWGGFGIHFTSNFADLFGGAVYAWNFSKVSWDGDGTAFNSNHAGMSGGALHLEDTSTVFWNGHGTAFSFNSANDSGGAIFVKDSSARWAGDGSHFISNYAGEYGDDGEFEAIDGHGGAIHAAGSTNVSWDTDGTVFDSNFASGDGGAIYMQGAATVSWDGHVVFSNNIANQDGGALASNNLELPTTATFSTDSFFAGYTDSIYFLDATFTNNSALNGGAMFMSNSDNNFFVYNMTFENNSASGAGGAVASYSTGGTLSTTTFSTCIFSGNFASGAGGAIETSDGNYLVARNIFEGNSAGIGGAARFGGSTVFRDSVVLSNTAYTRGPAIAVVGVLEISNVTFDANEISCAAGLYRQDTEEEDPVARYDAVCFDCPSWDECSNCSITRGAIVPTCTTPLEHTTSEEPGVTIETLTIDQGFWRATPESDTILACYNADACRGGKTEAEDYCASGYTGPYCAVCETDYSPSLDDTCTRCSSSRRQGLVAATIIAALVAVVVVTSIIKFLLSAEDGERGTGGLRRRALRAVPVQAVKIIVVVWQILTQFADVASASYPGVYEDFLNAVDVVNFDLGSVFAAACLVSDVDFHARLLVSTIGPLVVAGSLAITYRIAVRKHSASDGAAAIETIRHKHVTGFLFLTFLVYSSVSSMVFQTFACETLDDGIEYLRADYRIHCTDAKHKAFEVYAGFMIFLYPVGIPLLYAVMLFQRRDVLADACADKTVAQPIAGLWESYKPERFYYEVVECGRRILLTGVVVFIFPNTAAQIAITLLIAFFFFAVFEILSPYSSESDMWLSRGGHVIVFLSMFDSLLLRVDVSEERDQSQIAFAGVLVAGHVLMILAIVVEVVGICFVTRKKKNLEGEEVSERPRVGSDDMPVVSTGELKP